jgi:prepilin-type N-terminal cleavage/methylation domain-containing protein
MTNTAETAGTPHSEDGFTLVETLIALMILALSAGLLVQSVALATGQIRTAALAETAEFLAVSLLAERAAGRGNVLEAEGIDPASGLYWQMVQERHPRIIDDMKRAGGSIVSIEVRAAKKSARLYELRSISMEADTP